MQRSALGRECETLAAPAPTSAGYALPYTWRPPSEASSREPAPSMSIQAHSSDGDQPTPRSQPTPETLVFRELEDGPKSLQPGQNLGTRYHLVRHRGCGGGGEVWLAKDSLTGQDVALKFLNKSIARDNLLREARRAMRLSHERIVRVHGIAQAGDIAFLIMEYLSGQTLQEVFNALRHRSNERFSASDLDWILEQIVPALDLIHQRGMVHTDLKPGNLMFTGPVNFPMRESGQTIKITDLGLARPFRCTGDDTITDGSSLVAENLPQIGTPGYVAPELYRGEKPSPASDIYSLGVTLYFLSMGQIPPHKAPPLPRTGNERLDAAIVRCLSDDPNQRPDNASRVLQEARRRPTGIVEIVAKGSIAPIANIFRNKRGRAPVGCTPLDRRLSAEGLSMRVRHDASGLTFLLIEPNEFSRGSADGSGEERERPRHLVRLPKAFYLSQYLVTVAQWRRFVASSHFRSEAERNQQGMTLTLSGNWDVHSRAYWDNPFPQLDTTGMRDSESHPVTMVSWNDATAFCTQHSFRLPTEAEWECAARAGTVGDYFWGDNAKDGRAYGNFRDRAYDLKFPGDAPPSSARSDRVESALFPFDDEYVYTSPVGAFAPNRWGFYDMLGNVSEWCEDRFSSNYYQQKVRIDPICHEGEKRVIRGGSFADGPPSSRCAYRWRAHQSTASARLGFRPVIGV